MEGEDKLEKTGMKIGLIRKFLGEKQAILKRNEENTC